MSDPDRIKRTLAAELALVMLETPDSAFDQDEESAQAYINIAGKIIDRLVGKGVVVIDTQAGEDDTAEAHAARKTLEILTGWVIADPTRSLFTEYAGSGRFDLTLKEAGHTERFRGESVQDVYAQAAQVIALQ